MHPNFISKFVAVLNTLLEMTGSVSLIATHSSYFVREVFSDQVQIMRRGENNSIEIVSPNLRTFGSDVGLISQYVFGDKEHTSSANKVLDQISQEGLNQQEIIKKYKSELSQSLLMQVLNNGEDQNA